MAFPQYLLWANSRPTNTSADVWTKFYTQDHLAQFVGTKAAQNGAFYQEVPLDPNAKPHDMPYLALYQSNFKEPMKTKEFSESKQPESNVLKEAGLSQNPAASGEFDIRNYECVQDYDPRGVGNVIAPFGLTVEMSTTNPSGFDDWYRNEHLPLLSKMPGFVRALRYKAGPATGANASEQPMYLTVYFVEDLGKAFASEGAAKANATELTKKFLADSKPAAVGRAWVLLGKEGW